MGYEIKVLSDDEFDELPYEGIDDSLGLADVRRGRVFVRNTGSHELNRYLINHEIDHIVEEHATDEDEHGIRHKKFFKEIFLPLFTGYNAQQKTWSPLGIFDPKNLNPPKGGGSSLEDGAQQSQFGAQEMGQSGAFGQFSSGANASGSLPNSADGAVGGGLNKGSLNQGSLYGQQQSLSPEMIERIKGFYSGRSSF
jgi:hypothetical protein